MMHQPQKTSITKNGVVFPFFNRTKITGTVTPTGKTSEKWLYTERSMLR